ncbi:MAG: exodeoxyribonuclease VII large subunit [Bacteroidetes bacterium]|jgi:exodeoxyribonuclease VII large subunit|nr:exodeoxyribonuclease VII large subunit [Bacteroidota bacterium]MBT6686719.1 exodeoxyribonuclease VII large subunit [Bacteroidota bacterium]MBT7143243.1 exodeoxyribonuclease VII large subunit [Bacteroidota bacterium]MBT7492882.1 exodeoxyribonuclease VII large subunit [Bacteroidota bacterium]
MQNAISLSELNKDIKDVLFESFSQTVWVIAEISEIRETKAGHCYLELIEKDKKSNKVVAKMRATIWVYIYSALKSYFESSTSQELTAGIKILVNVTVEFHQQYGMSLNVQDIDPSYTVGDLAVKKAEIIARLEEEGVIGMNKEISLPMLPKNIAIISSETAAGYGDFVNQLAENQYGFKFNFKLFPAIMQGEKSVESIIQNLDEIFEYEDFFDLVVLIRGGGSRADLSCFDNYDLAFYITQFPIPVISGIGHERDDSIVDLVANISLKTPTAVADFIISKFVEAAVELKNNQLNTINRIKRILEFEKNKIQQLANEISPIALKSLKTKTIQLVEISNKIENATIKFISTNKNKLEKSAGSIGNIVQIFDNSKTQELNQILRKLKNVNEKFFISEKYKLDILKKSCEYLDPINVLNRGFSLTLKNGKIVKSIAELNENDIIENKYKDGKIKSRVFQIYNN